MANQWGRDSQAPASGGSRDGTVVAILIALVIGAAATYGYFRLTTTDQTVVMDDMRRAMEHQKKTLDGRDAELAQVKGDLEGARKRLQELEDAEALRDPEIATLRKRVTDQSAELDSLAEKVAVASEAEGRAIAEMQKVEVARKQAEDAVVAGDAAHRTLQGERDALAKELADLRDTSKASESETATVLAQLRDVTIPGLERERNELRQQLAAANAEMEEVKAREVNLSSQLESRRQAVAVLEGRLLAAGKEMEALQRQLAAQAAPSTKPAVPADPPGLAPAPATVPADAGPSQSQSQSQARAARDAGSVDAALGRSPGLGTLSAQSRAVLRTELLLGECVTDALGKAFDRVPVITLRNLIRDLKSDC